MRARQELRPYHKLKIGNTAPTGPNQVLVGLSDGRAIRARRVVCCLGPTGQLRIPHWAAPFRPVLQSGGGIEGTVLHSFELSRWVDVCDQRSGFSSIMVVCSPTGLVWHPHNHNTKQNSLGVSHTELYQGRHVIVVGGGLTAAHLVLSAHRFVAAAMA